MLVNEIDQTVRRRIVRRDRLSGVQFGQNDFR